MQTSQENITLAQTNSSSNLLSTATYRHC